MGALVFLLKCAAVLTPPGQVPPRQPESLVMWWHCLQKFRDSITIGCDAAQVKGVHALVQTS